MDVPVTIREAMAGGTVAVPTIDRYVNLKIPPKSQTGQQLKSSCVNSIISTIILHATNLTPSINAIS